jgi:starch phosphorylase
MRESMARLTPRFAANRAVREYTKEHYLPAAAAYHLRSADGGAIGRRVVESRHRLDEEWCKVHFVEVKVETRGDQHVLEVQVSLNDLDAKAVRVEAYADAVTGSAPVRREMKPVRQLAGEAGGYVYRAAVSAARPPADHTARLIPHCDRVAIPVEDARILWQR